MSLFPKTAIGEWRFHFAESVPVPVNGSDLEAQVIANPSGVCHASRLCLPLPYLRCQDTFYASSMVCLPLPGLTGTLPPMKNLEHGTLWLKLFQLICQASQSKVTLNQLLFKKHLQKTAVPTLMPYLCLHKGRRENKQVHSCTGCWLLDTAKMPAIAKTIHREDPVHPGPPATSPRINMCRVHRKGERATGHRIRVICHLSQVCVERVAPCTSPAHSPTSHLRASDPALVSQLLAQGYSSRNNKITLLWTLNFAFKIFYTFGLTINFSLQILTLVVPYGTVIGLKCPLNALL
jgi:hypothetical protein